MGSLRLKQVRPGTQGLAGVLRVVGGVGSRTRRGVAVGAVEGVGVAHRGVDADVEQFADASDVASAGSDFVEDAVFAQGLDRESLSSLGKASADGRESWAGLEADEKVRVDSGWPLGAAVVEPGSESRQDGFGERDETSVEVELAVADVGELEVAEFADGESVEGDERSAERGRGPWRVERVADGAAVEWQRDGVVGVGCWQRADGVDEDDLAAFGIPNSERSPCSTVCRREPLTGRTATMCSRSMLASVSWSFDAQIRRIGAKARM